MKITDTFNVPIIETIARERIITFFTRAGYRQLPDAGDGLHFRRGSVAGTLTSFNPTQWACTVNISVKSADTSSQISVEYEISTDPTEKDFAEELLTTELIHLKSIVTTNEFTIFDVRDLKKRITSHVFYVVAIFAALMFSVIVGVAASAFAAIILKISIWGSSAIGAGFLIVTAILFLIILRRQKKQRTDKSK
jgi:hypothetical protein